MVTLAVAPVCVPRCGGLLRVQRLDGDKRLVQERPHRREKVGVSAGHGGSSMALPTDTMAPPASPIRSRNAAEALTLSRAR